MKKILLPFILFFLTLNTQGALYIVVIGEQPPDLTHLCLGDTIRFSGNSTNLFYIGTISGMVWNADSTLNETFAVVTDTNYASHWDHILVNGDLGYIWSIAPPEYGTFIFNCASGISQASEKISSVVYPNPASTVIGISSIQPIQYLIVYDCFGKKIIDDQPGTEKKFLDISPLAKGIYFLEIKTHNQNIFAKFIKD